MTSRLRENVPTLFDVFAEVGAPSASNGGQSFILWKYPDDFNCPDFLNAITQFTFPGGLSTEPTDAVQLYSFVRTHVNGEHTFGYCRHTPKTNTCLCVVTAFPWPNFFYTFLNHVADVMNNQTGSNMESLLDRSYHQEVPRPGETFTVESSLGLNKLEIKDIPDPTKLPSFRENRHLMEFYNAVKRKDMISIYASMLRERRIVFTGHKLGPLSSCVIAANYLIYPMSWQHIFVPVLPAHLTDYLSAPMPFLIGVSKTLWEEALTNVPMELEMVVMDIDTQKLYTNASLKDYEDLPAECRSVLKHELDSTNLMLGDGLARSFLRATVMLLGNYRQGMRQTDDAIVFDFQQFVSEQKSSLRPYLEKMGHSQMLEKFFDERVTLLNTGKAADDEFEIESRNFEPRRLHRDIITSGAIGAFTALQLAAKEAPDKLKNPFDRLAAGATEQGSRIKRSIPKNLSTWTPKSSRSKEKKQRPFSDYDTTDVEWRHREDKDYRFEIGQPATEESAFGPGRLIDDSDIQAQLNARSSLLKRYDGEEETDEEQGELRDRRFSKSLTDLMEELNDIGPSSASLAPPGLQDSHPHSAAELKSLAQNAHPKAPPRQPPPSQRPPKPPKKIAAQNDLIDLGASSWNSRASAINSDMFDPLARLERTRMLHPPIEGSPVKSPGNFEMLKALFGSPGSANGDSSSVVSKRNSLPPPGEQRESVPDLRRQWETFE